MPVDSIITTTITRHMVSDRHEVEGRQAEREGVDDVEPVGAAATLSKFMRPIRAASTDADDDAEQHGNVADKAFGVIWSSRRIDEQDEEAR